MESLRKCGFAAHILMTPTERAIVDKDVGLEGPAPLVSIMQKVWSYVASQLGLQTALECRQL